MNFFVFVIFFFLPPLSLSPLSLSLSLSLSPVSPSLSPLSLFLSICGSLSAALSLSLSLLHLSLFLSFFSLFNSCPSLSFSLCHICPALSLSLFLSYPCLSLSPSPIFLSISLEPRSLSLSFSHSWSPPICLSPTLPFFLSFSVAIYLPLLSLFLLSLFHPCLSFSPIPASLFLPPLSFFLSLSNPGLSPFLFPTHGLLLSVSLQPCLSFYLFLSLFISHYCLSFFFLSSIPVSLSLYLWFTLCGFLFLFLSRSCLSFYLFSLSLYHPYLSSYLSLSHPESLFIFPFSLPPLSFSFSLTPVSLPRFSLSHTCILSHPLLYLCPTPDQLTN